MRFYIDTSLQSPIYKQIVDEVCRALKDGTLKNGDKMPTVRELACELDVARGTIKHAYTELQRLGLITMTQGRGTFIKYEEPVDMKSKKERAIRAIDTLLDDMESMSFTLREIQIFFDLKLRERSDEAQTIEVAALGECAEEVAAICDALGSYRGITVRRMMLDDILCSPNKIDSEIDMIITEHRNCEKLRHAVSDYSRVTGICLETAPKVIAELARIDDEKRVAMVAFSKYCLDIIEETFRNTADYIIDADMALFSNTNSVKRALSSSDVIIVPDCYEKLCGANMKAMLSDYMDNGGKLIRFARIPDGGSRVSLDVKIQNVKDSLKSAIPY